ncbi:MAG: asparagine synthase-related protein, partial [Candidatus Acidiferrales bacterium]
IEPYVAPSGQVFLWDGRLDNRGDLIGRLDQAVASHDPDVKIVAAAFEQWERACFRELIGDWALSIWNPRDQSLYLARDFVGTRLLYYRADLKQIAWSTLLDPLLEGRFLALNEEYLAGCLGLYPAPHLTPYEDIHSVPPSFYVHFQRDKKTVASYWDFNPHKIIRYRTDGDYEEHFRTLLAEAVRRRLRSDSPVLAELSGGMDSASIVCVADNLIAQGRAEIPRLETLSYYDDSEPNWNERPYFAKVEEKRRRTGCHIDVGAQRNLWFESSEPSLASTPNSVQDLTEAAKQFGAFLASEGIRVVLSGIGGDEVLAGVPTAIPELADSLASLHFAEFRGQLVAWALAKRKPVLHLAAETLRAFLPVRFTRIPKRLEPPEWLNKNFVKRNLAALTGYQRRVRFLGPAPSFQGSLATLDVLRRQLGCSVLSPEPPYEKRYPYLDRDLLEFLYSVPREQLLRPHERRSLMRRSLRGIVPEEILTRKRKAFLARSPLAALSADWPQVCRLTQNMLSSSMGIVNQSAFTLALEKARRGKDVPLVPLLRTLRIECWLQQLERMCALRSVRVSATGPLLRTSSAS